jgi:UDP-N-acetylmuramoylalanine--D-glutamate ligase
MRALVLGLGESGLAMARHLAREGYALAVHDSRAEPPGLAALRAELPQAAFTSGAWPEDAWEGLALVAISPGLSPHEPPIESLLKRARQAGAEVTGEIELFARALAGLREARGYAPRIIGITGTNGKTTTTRMAGAMLQAAGIDACVAGNISPSALDALHGALARDALPQAWVLELSSFQLATTTSLVCDAATILNLTEDHLDWHDGMGDYIASKMRIFAPGTLRVVNRDDSLAERLRTTEAPLALFGHAPPAALGEFGLVREGGLLWLACTDEAPARKRKPRARKPALIDPAALPAAPAPIPEEESVFVHRLMPVDALGVRGLHNAMNALAALALVRAAGAPLAPALRALARYRGEPHRVETVATVAGVDYVDDSKGTNVGATVAALEGLGAGAGGAPRIVVILGGDGKGQSFAPLAQAVAAHASAAVLIGRDAPAIAQALEAATVPVLHAHGLEEAVAAAATIAHRGDIVLLSPACASFDAFLNYAHRAQVFRDAVRALGAQGAAGTEAKVVPLHGVHA